MTRLPVVGSDINNWGTLLNAFLAVAHNADGSLNLQNGVLQIKDLAGVAFSALYVDVNGYTTLQCPPDTNIGQFIDNAGNTIVYFDGGNGILVLGPGKFYAGEDPSHHPGGILGVDQSNSYTQVKAHQTGNGVEITDSSNVVLATFVSTNKIFTTNGGQIVERTGTSSTSYTVLASDYIVAVTSTSSAVTVTLPAAAAGNAGQVWIVKDESGGAATHNITVKTNGGTIDGVAAGTGKVINTNYGSLKAYSNGTNYFTI